MSRDAIKLVGQDLLGQPRKVGVIKKISSGDLTRHSDSLKHLLKIGRD